ncbi:MAG: hypothetical protein H0V07_12490, partial [Propionibacteriales bacterium]|nr:hypothetical protein [Propionibacteriales bacterium]
MHLGALGDTRGRGGSFQFGLGVLKTLGGVGECVNICRVRCFDLDRVEVSYRGDRGVQYRAIRYTERLAEAEAVASVGSKGDSYDNAMAEAFNSLFKAECIRNPVMRPKG